MAHRRQKPRSVSGKAFNVSEATDTGRTFVRIKRGHRVIRQRIVQLISAVQWVALYHKVKRNKESYCTHVAEQSTCQDGVKISLVPSHRTYLCASYIPLPLST